MDWAWPILRFLLTQLLPGEIDGRASNSGTPAGVPTARSCLQLRAADSAESGQATYAVSEAVWSSYKYSPSNYMR